jgi:hypothetical protein
MSEDFSSWLGFAEGGNARNALRLRRNETRTENGRSE